MSPVRIIRPERFHDDRGWFSVLSSPDMLRGIAPDLAFVQENQSCSHRCFTLRGLHFQLPPHGQDKLVRCVRGRIFDVAVDIRHGSPTWGRWVGSELSADNGHQMFTPIGFAHGFITLEDHCEVAYRCSSGYAPEQERGLRWNDEMIDIDWPVPMGVEPILSAKDALLPGIAEFDSPFVYDGQPLQALA